MHYATCLLVLFWKLFFFWGVFRSRPQCDLEMLWRACNMCIGCFVHVCPNCFWNTLTRPGSRAMTVHSELLFTLCTGWISLFGAGKYIAKSFVVAGNPSDPVHAFLTRCQTCSISLNMSRVLYVFSRATCHWKFVDRQTTPQQLETYQSNAKVIGDIKISKAKRKDGKPLDGMFGSLRNIRSGWHLQMQCQVVPDWEESNASFGLCVETKFCMYLRIQNERMLWIVEDSNIGRSLIFLRSISSLALVYRPGCVWNV